VTNFAKNEELTSDIKNQVRDEFVTEDQLSLLWALQIDDYTDSTGKARLAYIRLIKNAKFVNQYLFRKELKTTTRGEDIFEVVNENILFL